ncbi:hypothetical protein PENTCL1PPCAC_24234, partial [Pristionchus entomophagus]
MSSAAKSVRASKREVIVIDDDESTSEQPVMKSVKREEEPVPSSEVVELQQKVIKLEDTVQRACRAARTAELRAEAAEIRLDAKYGIKDGFLGEKERADELEKRVNDLSILLATERQQAIDNQTRDRARIEELTQKLSHYEDGQQLLHNLMQSHPPPAPPAQLQLLLPPPPPPPVEQLLQQQQKQHTADLERRVKDLSKLLATEQQQAIDNRSRDRARLEEISMKLEVEKSKVSELTHQNVELNVSLAIRNESDLQKRNDELTQRLAQYEGALQPLLQLQQQQQPMQQLQQQPMLQLQQQPRLQMLPSVQPVQLQNTQQQPQKQQVTFAKHRSRSNRKIAAAAPLEPTTSPGWCNFSSSSSAPSTSVPAAAAANAAPPFNNRHVRHQTGHPTNIFQLCHPGSGDAMMLNKARVVLTAAYQKDCELIKSHGTYSHSWNLECEMCQRFFTSNVVVPHFLSKKHQSNVTAANAAVSRHAVAYWVGRLTNVAQRSKRQSFARPMHLPPAAAAAATQPMQPVSTAVAATTRPVKPVPAAVAAITRPMQPVAAAVAATT